MRRSGHVPTKEKKAPGATWASHLHGLKSKDGRDTNHFDMDFSNVDIEEVGFDRPCTKDVHGSLGSLDIQLCAVRLKREMRRNLHCRSFVFLATFFCGFIAYL